MHMSDALLSVVVGGTMTALSTGAIAHSVNKINKIEFDEKKIPMMGVMGAFVFAAQMINFTIPATGSSGHIGGGILLAALLGPYEALITIASVLLIQCLFFADGGLLALGANIFNMGVITCFVAYPLIYKPIIKKMTPKRITIASMLAVVVGLQLGSFLVVVETTASGIAKLPFIAFMSLMQPIHLAIGIVEGIVTATVVCFIYKVRKEILDGAQQKVSVTDISIKKVFISMLVATVFIGGILSIYASSNPDGLEWSIQEVAGTTELEKDTKAHQTVSGIQERTAILPDYSLKSEKEVPEELGTSLSGIVGGLFTLTTTVLAGFILIKVKKNKNKDVMITIDKE